MASAEPPRFLLLLPPPPSPTSHAALKAAFGDTLSQVLKEVATHTTSTSKAAVLEVALACPHLVGNENVPRSSLYAPTQSIVAAVYKLICLVAARDGVNIEDADGVDVRVLLVAWDTSLVDQGSSISDEQYGPIISLEALAKSGRRWQFAFGVESEAGETMVKAFVSAKGSGEHISRARSGPVMNDATAGDSSSSIQTEAASDGSQRIHHHVAVGGTFDHIHIGHKLLLTMTIFALDKGASAADERSATIGITGDQLLVNKKHAEHLESWADRQRTVATFVNALIDFSPASASGQRHVSVRDDPGPNGKSLDIYYPDGVVLKCTEIQDPFGPTITEEQISAIIISAETRAGGKAVNDKREEKGWKALEVFEVDVLDAEDDNSSEAKDGFESKLSSTAIREKLAKKFQSSL